MLGSVHRSVGAGQELEGLFGSVEGEGNADRGPDADPLRPHFDGVTDGLDDPPGDIGSVADADDSFGDDDKPVASKAGHEVPATQADRQTGGDLAQNLVTHFVAVTVVDRLEVVEVHVE